MSLFLKLISLFAITAMISACETYPYALAFSGCDDKAGACYRECEAYADDAAGYGECHASCETEANQCFSGAYSPYRETRSNYGYGSSYGYSPGYSSYGYASPWYGQHGSWYPDIGYVFGFAYSTTHYGYQSGRHSVGRSQRHSSFDQRHINNRFRNQQRAHRDRDDRPLTGERHRSSQDNHDAGRDRNDTNTVGSRLKSRGDGKKRRPPVAGRRDDRVNGTPPRIRRQDADRNRQGGRQSTDGQRRQRSSFGSQRRQRSSPPSQQRRSIPPPQSQKSPPPASKKQQKSAPPAATTPSAPPQKTSGSKNSGNGRTITRPKFEKRDDK